MASRHDRKRRDRRHAETVVARRVVVVPRRVPIPSRKTVRAVEDRREFHPAGRLRPIRGFMIKPRLVLRKPNMPNVKSRKWYSPVINVPERTAVCVRRKERKEVLHALKRTGGRGGSRRFNETSKIGC